MSAIILDGKKVSHSILEELKQKVKQIKSKYNLVPGLATLLIGDHPASKSYVRLKIKTAKKLGFHEIQDHEQSSITQEALLKKINSYNQDKTIHGILVQLPLPKHIDSKKILLSIDPSKDVDGFHPFNVGNLVIEGENNLFTPCTPAGILELLCRYNIKVKGKEVVIVGRSNIVGKPMANLLFQKTPSANATVTIVHSASKNIDLHCKRADILIVAAGVPHLIKTEWIKKKACVIDVGVNQIGETISKKTGKIIPLLRGDVDFQAIKKIASHLTPVPGGVGPMTIAMLMKNTIKSCEYHLNKI